MKILVTAFEPYGGQKINASERLLKEIDSPFIGKKLVVPTSYQHAISPLQQEILAGDFTDVVMLGEAGARSKVCMERIALNWMDAMEADEDGQVFLETEIAPGARQAYLTPYPLRQWQQKAVSAGLPMDISLSAGAFVCNALSYQLAHWLTQSNSTVKGWLFVHVPFLPEQTVAYGKGMPGLPLATMKSCLNFILEQIAAG